MRKFMFLVRNGVDESNSTRLRKSRYVPLRSQKMRQASSIQPDPRLLDVHAFDLFACELRQFYHRRLAAVAAGNYHHSFLRILRLNDHPSPVVAYSTAKVKMSEVSCREDIFEGFFAVAIRMTRFNDKSVHRCLRMNMICVELE